MKKAQEAHYWHYINNTGPFSHRFFLKTCFSGQTDTINSFNPTSLPKIDQESSGVPASSLGLILRSHWNNKNTPLLFPPFWLLNCFLKPEIVIFRVKDHWDRNVATLELKENRMDVERNSKHENAQPYNLRPLFMLATRSSSLPSGWWTDVYLGITKPYHPKFWLPERMTQHREGLYYKQDVFFIRHLDKNTRKSDDTEFLTSVKRAQINFLKRKVIMFSYLVYPIINTHTHTQTNIQPVTTFCRGPFTVYIEVGL